LPGWPESVITMQRNWIGRSKGLEIQFSLVDHPETVTVFTTRPDTLMGASYLAIAPRHPLALQMAEKNPAIAHFLEQCAQGKVAEADQAAQEKYGVASGLHAYHPLTQALLPIWITNFVLMEYGTGAIMAVPAHDARDHEFATHYHLPIQPVIQAPVEWDYKQAAHVEKGTLIHSGEFNGLRFEEAYSAIYALLREKGAAEERINYRLRDWGISRQRYWGTPIPMINCARCGSVPVPESNLPVILPTHLIPTGQGSPLKQDQSFIKTTCPECQGSAERETDTFDTFVESSWYYARYCSYNQAHAMLDKRTVYWTPVDQYIGGIEHAILHLLYARFFHKLLRDQGLVHSDEPFTRLLTQGMVLKDGSKMSKSRGNVVPPTPLIEKYGADTVRLFIIFAAPPEQALEWSDQGVEGAYRFLSRLWQWSSALPAPFRALAQSEHNPLHTLTASQQQFRRTVHVILHQANQDMERQQFNTVVSACMKLFNVISKYEEENETGRALLREAMGILLRLLAPIAPHITHTLWQSLGYGENILHTDWPRVDQHALQTDEKQMVIQINGKLRSTISVNANATHQAIEMAALKDEKIGKHLEGKQVTKIIVVPGKLVNIVIK
ncbi:MAG TPA: class I tRNA ligase family protein, partial [Coxiellaceae bacterium]|nr:class I tRNA ligase family protein [Coxiellaceae bacterium]